MKRFFLGVFVILLGTWSLSGQSIRFATKLAIGDSRQITIDSQTITTVSAMGAQMETTMNTSIGMDIKVKEVFADSLLLECSYTTMDYIMQSPQMKQSFGVNGDDPLSEAVKSMVGKVVVLSYNPSEGKTRLIDAGDLTSAFEEILSVYATKKRKNYIAQITAAFGADAMAKSAESIFMKYPPLDLKSGYVWMDSQMIEDGGAPTSVDTQYKLEEIGAENSTLSAEVVANLDTSKGAIEMNGMTMTSMSGTGSGTCIVNNEKGWLISSQMTQTMKCRCEVQGIEIPMTIVIKSSVK